MMPDLSELAEQQIEAAARALAIWQLRESYGPDAWESLLSAVKLQKVDRVMGSVGHKLREQASCVLWAGEQQGIEGVRDRLAQLIETLEFYKAVAGLLIRENGGEVTLSKDDLSAPGSIMWRKEQDLDGEDIVQIRSVLQESQAAN